ncbi:maleylpyruvate isomerase N-terminal domain-containing protein [Nocardiopsis sp. NPDC049922]|uniref:maleylpyruvate isomerase N-terminal domain-containing protein n=1 Tax=Nocardiopsis sp. NPDC049922 TaxID=3155157 RepID=UPI0033E7E6D5
MNTLKETSAEWRANHAAAARWYQSVTVRAADHLDAPGLGEWSVRDLVGHTSRALSTVASYLGATGAVEVASAADYLRAGSTADPAAIAERGRAAGVELGVDPAGAVADLVDRVLSRIDEAPDDALVGTPFGVMTLAEYLPTRTFELVVHTCDLAAALGERPVPPAPAARSALHLAGALASDRLGEVLLALTGRAPLPVGFSVFGGASA